jgi:hypothetical protein
MGFAGVEGGGIDMELYFGSMKGSNADIKSKNLVTFTIPDLGVKFKAPFPAEDLALDYASLLTLLEFIEINPQLFTNRALELYSHNSDLVDQIKSCQVDEKGLVPYLQRALQYRAKLKFSINWIPNSANPS